MRRVIAPLITALLAFLAGGRTQAQTYVWNDPAGGNWLTGAWTPGPGSPPDDEFKTASFSAAFATPPATIGVTIGGPITVGGIVFNSAATRYTLSAGTVTTESVGNTVGTHFFGAGATVNLISSAAQGSLSNQGSLTFDSGSTLNLARTAFVATGPSGTTALNGTTNLTANAAVSFTGNGAVSVGGNLVLGGAATLTNLGSQAVSLAGTVSVGSHTLTLDGAGGYALGTGLTGSGVLTKTGTGSMTIGGANTGFTGRTVIDNGTVTITDMAAFGNGTGSNYLTVNGNGKVDITANTTLASNRGIGGNFGEVSVRSGVTFTVSGASSGNVNKQGLGTLLINAGTTSGNWYVEEGLGILDGPNRASMSVEGTGVVRVVRSMSLISNIFNQGEMHLVGGAGGITVSPFSGTVGLNGYGNGAGPDGGAVRNVSGNNTLSSEFRVFRDSTVKVDAGSLNMTGGIRLEGTTLVLNTVAGTTLAATGVTGGGRFVKSGAGTVTLTGTVNNTGAGGGNVVRAGTLLLNTTSADPGATFTVNSGAKFGGAGISSGSVTVDAGGTLRPGGLTTTGLLRVNTGVTFSSGSTFAARVNGDTAGTLYDQLVVGSAGVGLNGVTLSLAFGGPVTGSQKTIIRATDGGQLTGEFAGLPNGSFVLSSGGFDWGVFYLPGENGRVFLAPVPEPTGLMFAVAAAVVGFWRVRRWLPSGPDTGYSGATAPASD